MIRQLKQKLAGQKRVAGLEVIFSPEGKINFHCVLISLKENLVSVDLKEKISDDIGKLKDLIPVNIPLVLSVSGKGILHKRIKDDYADEAQLFNQIFPNSKYADYYVQKTASDSNHVFVSLTRKDLSDQILSKLKEQGYFVTNVSLGPFVVSDVHQLLPFEAAVLGFGNHELTFKKNLVENYKIKELSEEINIKVGNESIPGDYLVAYSTAFLDIIDGERVHVEIPEVVSQKDEFKEKAKFKKIGIGILSIFLMMLLINTLLFTTYNQENQKLAVQVGKLSDLSANLEGDEKDLHQKEAFLNKAGWLAPARASYYSDQLAALLPASITLTKMAKNPYNEKESRSQRRIIFDNGTLRVDGYCARPTELNSWIKKIKEQDWVKDVNVQDYTFDHKSGAGNFIVQIVIKGELE